MLVLQLLLILSYLEKTNKEQRGGLTLPTPYHIDTHTHIHTEKLEIIKSIPQFSLESAIIVLVLTVLMIIPRHKSSIYQVQ